MLAREGGGR